jgi:hypothetical protein
VNSAKLGSLLLRVCGLFFLYYLQSLDHLEGEAHYAALLALVLDEDGLIVVVDEYLGEHPAVVVEALDPTLGWPCSPPCLLARSSVRPPFLVILLSTPRKLSVSVTPGTYGAKASLYFLMGFQSTSKA